MPSVFLITKDEYDTLRNDLKEIKSEIRTLKFYIADLNKEKFSPMEINKNFLDKLISDIQISTRTRKCLESANIQTIKELCLQTECELLKIRNFGKKSITELRGLLFSQGLTFGMCFLGDLQNDND